MSIRIGIAAASLLSACVPVAPPDGTVPAMLVIGPAPAPNNSPAFARRSPLPGHPDYLLTIKYIDDGMRYVDAPSRFFISPAGEMCFRVAPNYPQVIYEAGYRTWCIYPQTVDRVEAATNDTTNINGVRLWCMHAYPQCIHSPEVGWVVNNISASSLDYQQERAALENLIHIMGGNTQSSQHPIPPHAGLPALR